MTVSCFIRIQEVPEVAKEASAADESKDSKKGHYVGIHASGFKDFLLKPELLRAIVDAGFEHPSEVQHESIPQAVLGGDIICQAKSGMGKTAGTYRERLLSLKSMLSRVVSISYSLCASFNSLCVGDLASAESCCGQ